MSEIPYYFETPIPKYFRENGWFKNPNTILFVTWAFSRCSNEPYKMVLQGKEITVSPFEFLAGRKTNPQECFLTEKQFRGQLFTLLDAGLLKKTANSKANQYTFYKWSIECFSKHEGQQNGQRRANEGPTKGHNQESRRLDYVDDLFDSARPPKKEKSGSSPKIEPLAPTGTETQHNMNYQTFFENVPDKNPNSQKIIELLLKEGYSPIEIQEAINSFKSKPRKISDLPQYLRKSINNKRDEVKRGESLPRNPKPKTPSRSLSEEYSTRW